VDRRDIPRITKSIIHQLHAVRRQELFYTASSSIRNDEASSSEQRDLENVIEAVLLEFRRSVQCSDKPETGEEEATAQSKPPAQFELENKTQRIRLRPSVAADPAITLSIPQTSFTTTDAKHKYNGIREEWQRGASTMTTLVSPQSTTSITWTKHGGHLGEPSESPSESSTTADSPSDENSESTSQTRRTSSCHGHSQDQKPQTSQASLGAPSIASTITSFPKLLSRHCTREWIRPLANSEDLHRRASTELSYQGANSHANRPSHHDMPFNESSFPLSWAGDNFQSRNPSGYFTNEIPNDRRSTVSQSSLNAKGFGSQIGSAAHRRRSTASYDIKASILHDQFLPNILSKFFNNSNRGSPGSPDSKDTMHSGAFAPYNSPAHGHLPVNTPKSGNVSFTERDSTVLVEDRTRIHEVLVGGTTAGGKRRRDTCSEDNRPHVCEDDIDNRVR
jgi:hypothetical protein